MDPIEGLCQAISDSERKEFLHFISRNQKRKPEKIAELFVLICSGTSKDREELLERLYPEGPNVVAYHAARKRLIKELTSFLVHLHNQKDTSSEGEIEKYLLASKYLFLQNLNEIAWNYLAQAEEQAIRHESYLLLNTIYSFQIEKSGTEFAPDLKHILQKKESAMKLASDQDNATIAYQIVRHKLSKALESGQELNIEKEVSKVLNTLELSGSMQGHPRILFNLISIVRAAALIRKDFYSLEPFLKKYYQKLSESEKFHKHNHDIKIQLLYMLGHTLYRNKKFKEAEMHLQEMSEDLERYNRAYYSAFYPKYCLLKAVVLNYTNRNSEAIQLLKEFIDTAGSKTDRISLFNGYLNLSTCYFQNGQYHSSIKVFQNIQHSDKWLSGIMGREWVMKKHLIECINQFEIGNTDLVQSRIRVLRRNFRDLFDRPMYQRVLVFIGLMEKLLVNPEVAASKAFRMEVEKSFRYIEAEKEDIQAITFYAWLKGRMTRRNYYEVLMELVSP